MNAADLERMHAHGWPICAHDWPDLDELEQWLARLDDATEECAELARAAPHLRGRLEVARRNLARARRSVWSELVSSGDARGDRRVCPSGTAGGVRS